MEGGASHETGKEWFYRTRVGDGVVGEGGRVQVGRLFYGKALNHM